MDVVSLGFRTDLALLRLSGSVVEDRGDHLVVRTPGNPAFWWGNFLLLAEPPGDGDGDVWLDRFAAEFPAAAHRTFGIDGTDLTRAHASCFAARGLTVYDAAVLTATAVHEPVRPGSGADYRALTGDDDWAQSIELRMRCDTEYDPALHRAFVIAKAGTNRQLVADGHGTWFGAFVEGRLVAQLGIVRAGDGLARFQAVETEPAFRRQGHARALLHRASRAAFDRLDARTLVIVADRDYVAIELYRAAGFAVAETQLQAERPPG